MTSQTRSIIVYANYLAAAAIGCFCVYLISMPLHPPVGDSHAGFLAVFSGLFVAPVAIAAFAAGRLFQRKSRYAWLLQVAVLAAAAALVLELAL